MFQKSDPLTETNTLRLPKELSVGHTSPLFSIEKGGELSKKHDISPLFKETKGKSIFTCKMGWSKEGILGNISTSEDFDKEDLSDPWKSDGLFIFFDTKNQKKYHHATPFCHAFHLFLGKNQKDSLQKLKTKYTDSKNLEVSPSLFSAQKKIKKNIETSFFIPKELLSGFNPEEFPFLGCAWVIQKNEIPFSYFGTTPEIEPLHTPHLWFSFQLITT